MSTGSRVEHERGRGAAAVLELGAEWVVEFEAMGMTWRSRSVVDELNPAGGRFVHRSFTDDGNPSYGRWVWQVEGDGDGSRVRVEWKLHPKTFWRRAVLSHVRNRQLRRREVPASLHALARVAGIVG